MRTTTFFSYKGGAGRSTTCFNTVPFLAKKVSATKLHPVLLIDMDIESAGMTYLLNMDKAFHDEKRYDVKRILKNELKFVTSKCDIFSNPLYQQFIPVGKQLGLDDDYAVMFLGVNDYSEQLDRNEIQGDARTGFSRIIDFAYNNSFGAVVMDSAAGDQFSANIALSNSDNVVFCMKMTHQFRIGTFNYLHKFANTHTEEASHLDFILLPTVVPNDAVIDGESQLQTSIKNIQERIENLKQKDLKTKLKLVTTFVNNKDTFGINEVVRFKWKEGILFKLQANKVALQPDELKALKQYEMLAITIK